MSPFLLLSHATARSPLDLKMRVPSHPYERGTYSPTGHKAKSDKEGRKRPKKKRGEKKRNGLSPKIWTIVVTPGCFIKSTREC